MKQVHYNLDNIEKENANYNIIYGEKSNGKSYQVKHKRAVEKYLETGKRFILLRRWREDITNLWIESYFSDVDVLKLTEKKYNAITVYRKALYLSNIDDAGKVIRGEKIGYVMALSTEQHYSGASFLDVEDVIFEEFMERGSYIANEPKKFEFLYSTIDRKRGSTRVWLVGNTISRVNPYIKAWGLDSIFRSIEQGSIKTKTIENENIDESKTTVKIAVEYCRSSGGKTMSISNSNSIDKRLMGYEPTTKTTKF